MKKKKVSTPLLLILFIIACAVIVLLSKVFYTRQNSDYAMLRETHHAGVDCSKLLGWCNRGDVSHSCRSICAGDRAWYENEPNFCKLHDDPESCYHWMANKTGNIELCRFCNDDKTGYYVIKDKLIDDEKINAGLYGCYEIVSKYHNDHSICEKIPYKTDSLMQKCRENVYSFKDVFSEYGYNDNSPI